VGHFQGQRLPVRGECGSTESQDLEKVKPFLSTIKPMKAAFDHDFVKLIDGPNIKKGKNKYELARRSRMTSPTSARFPELRGW